MSSKAAPLVILGLDGAGFHLLNPLMAAGRMPHVQTLCAQGWQADLMSTQPPATLPAWTSFLTAASPAVHGVCDMFVPLPGSYDLQAAGSTMRAVPTFLRRLAEAGLKVASLGIPGTYPPDTALELCVSGFDAPGVREVTARGVHPSSFYPTLRRLGGWRFATFNENADGAAAPGDHAAKMLLRDLAVKERVILHLLARTPWDVFFVHLQASDTAAHHLWHTYDAQSPRHVRQSSALADVYARLDTLVGNVRAALTAQHRLMLVSDHGMGGAGDMAVYLNRRLHAEGLLQFKAPVRRALRRLPGALLRGAAARLPVGAPGTVLRHLPAKFTGALITKARHDAVDHARSRAFSFELDYAPAVWLHRRGVFPQGFLEQAEADALAHTLAERLRAWRCPFTHGPLFDAVLPRDPAHPWPCRAPDLLLVPAWPGGYRYSFLPSPGPGPAVCTLPPAAFGAPKGSGMPGVHRAAGICVAHGPGIAPARLAPLNIADAGALVYAMAQVAPPPFCDADLARVADLWPLPGAASMQAAAPSAAADPHTPYTPQQNHALLQRLADMGYL